jgi:hypothetical protein
MEDPTSVARRRWWLSPAMRMRVCVCFNACMDALWVFVCVRGAGARVDGSRDAVERRG